MSDDDISYARSSSTTCESSARRHRHVPGALAGSPYRFASTGTRQLTGVDGAWELPLATRS